MPPFRQLTIFFPMWNEEAYVCSAVRAAQEAGRTLVACGEIGDYEILLIDDGSIDQTSTIAQGLAHHDEHIRLVRHRHNRGLGAGLKTGFSQARGDLVLYSDADLPCDLLELRKAIRLLQLYDADLISAYRHDRTIEGMKRIVYSLVYNWLIRLLFRLPVRDVNFPFKLCRKDLFLHVELQSEGSFIDAELLTRAHRLGFTVRQFGVDFFPRDRGVSRLSSFGTIIKIIREMRRLRPQILALKPLPALLRQKVGVVGVHADTSRQVREERNCCGAR